MEKDFLSNLEMYLFAKYISKKLTSKNDGTYYLDKVETPDWGTPICSVNSKLGWGIYKTKSFFQRIVNNYQGGLVLKIPFIYKIKSNNSEFKNKIKIFSLDEKLLYLFEKRWNKSLIKKDFERKKISLSFNFVKKILNKSFFRRKKLCVRSTDSPSYKYRMK